MSQHNPTPGDVPKDPVAEARALLAEARAPATTDGDDLLQRLRFADVAPRLLGALVEEVERLRHEQRLDLADVDRFRSMARKHEDQRDDALAELARLADVAEQAVDDEGRGMAALVVLANAVKQARALLSGGAR
jgi:hypothetical protein